MSRSKNKQNKIKDWFDETYKEKGFSYLRPPRAYKAFINILKLKSGNSVLDVGCGPGLFLKLAHEIGCNCSGIDLSQQAVSMAQSYVPESDIRLGNAENLPFLDNSFDVVVCLGALERFVNLEEALAQQLRVAKKNSLFCFLVRNSNSFLWFFNMKILKRQNRAGHQNAKSLDQWINLFESNEFTIEKIFPDQWPLQKITSFLPLGIRRKLLPTIHNGVLPLRFAGEFVFLLSAKTSS